MADTPRVPAKEWNPQEALQSLVFEQQMEDGNAVAATSKLLREHALLAASSIAHLAAYSSNDRVRLQAATFIVDKTLESELDADLRLAKEQAKQVGHALLMIVRTLALRYNFDPDAPEVRVLAHQALMAASHNSGPIAPPE